ncbi:hypothetical protein BZA77DRAFT_61251 [Pyronema omphalodes]|nr:hypothetical protein BZA77DRAFT_61251 [Pyronema omphalodes]
MSIEYSTYCIGAMSFSNCRYRSLVFCAVLLHLGDGVVGIQSQNVRKPPDISLNMWCVSVVRCAHCCCLEL